MDFPNKGFSLSGESCSGNNLNQLWDLRCPELRNYPEKNLKLMFYHQYFLKGTTATYECLAGHGHNELEVNLTLECLSDGQWSSDPLDIPECVPIECQKPLQPDDETLSGTLSYQILLNMDKTLAGTLFEFHCPEDKYLANGINHFDAKCGFDG